MMSEEVERAIAALGASSVSTTLEDDGRLLIEAVWADGVRLSGLLSPELQSRGDGDEGIIGLLHQMAKKRFCMVGPESPHWAPAAPRHKGKVIGFRAWTLDGYNLVPLNAQFGPWKIGENKAVCKAGVVGGFGGELAPHDAPHASCSCGLYAYHELPPSGFFTYRLEAHVFGAVLAWGALEVHQTGFRAEYAEPVLLAYNEHTMPYRQVVNLMSIGSEMGVPVVPVNELHAEARKLGDVVPEELRPKAPDYRDDFLRPAMAYPGASGGLYGVPISPFGAVATGPLWPYSAMPSPPQPKKAREQKNALGAFWRR